MPKMASCSSPLISVDPSIMKEKKDLPNILTVLFLSLSAILVVNIKAAFQFNNVVAMLIHLAWSSKHSRSGNHLIILYSSHGQSFCHDKINGLFFWLRSYKKCTLMISYYSADILRFRAFPGTSPGTHFQWKHVSSTFQTGNYFNESHFRSCVKS